MNQPSKRILLTGGTGLLGKQLTELLLAKGYAVSHLSRTRGKDVRVKTYIWNVTKGQIDEKCIERVDTIIHLAGAGVAEKRWTDKRKKELTDSRIKSIQLIYDLLKRKPNQVKKVISASATGYYGDRGEELLTEDSRPADDFLATLCIKWEKAADEGEAMGLKVLKLRTGIVLDKNGGALPLMAAPVKFGIGSPLGSGKQWMPWIHHKDAVNMYVFALENEDLTGVYNMTAPAPVTNAQLTKALGKQLKRPVWLPKVPAFLLNLLFGEMGIVVLGGARVSPLKIERAGFEFKYADIESALKEIYG